MNITTLKTHIKNHPKAWGHSLLLLIWIIIGTWLRFTLLEEKPPWADEFSTMIFSLGNSYRTVPLNTVISIDTLLQPLQPNPEVGINSVINNLMTESTHPPVYFILTHLWLKLFSPQQGLVSLWAARALSAILGVVAIPAIFSLAWVVFDSIVIAQIAAGMMAVSPFGVYLAQDARHYTLAILLIMAALGCFIKAYHNIIKHQNLSIFITLTWLIINVLGIAVHYFFALSICAQGLVLMRLWINNIILPYFQPDKEKKSLIFRPWLRIYLVAIGSFIGGLVWLPFWKDISDNNLTEWIYQDNILQNFLAPIARILAGGITMLSLLPLEKQPLPITIICGGIMALFLIVSLPLLWQGAKMQMQGENNLSWRSLGEYILAAIFVMLCITYLKRTDLTLAARYQFIYFPALLLFLASSIAVYWQENHVFFPLPKINYFLASKKAVILILIMGLLGGITVAYHLGYQKSDRSDLVAPIILQQQLTADKIPVLIANVQKTHEQTGEIMGIAWELKRLHYLYKLGKLPQLGANFPANFPQFLLVHKSENTQLITDRLHQILADFPRPVDMWTVNFSAQVQPEAQKCVNKSGPIQKVSGYNYRLYQCL